MEKLKTINIKGKEYVEVNTRIKALKENFKDYSIETEVLNFTPEYILMRAVVKNESGRIMATGTAMEEKNAIGSMVNKTSFVENCETSAVGRALGMLGIGIDQSVASYEEVKNAIEQQEAQEKPKPKKALSKEEKIQKYKDYLNLLTIEEYNKKSKEDKEKIQKMLMAVKDLPFASDDDVEKYLENKKVENEYGYQSIVDADQI